MRIKPALIQQVVGTKKMKTYLGSVNTWIYKDKHKPRQNAASNTYVMPPCNCVTHQKNAQINSYYYTVEGHRADIPETKHLARWIDTVRTWSGHKNIHN